MNAQQVLGYLRGVRPSGDGWSARCPAHDDQHASLAIREGRDGRILLRCHAGCTVEEICAAIHIEVRDLFPSSGTKNNGRTERVIAATYDYRDAEGQLVLQVVRFEPKDFRQRRPDGTGGWEWNLKGIEKRPLYRLPELLNSDSSALAFVTEGEKDADRLASLGLVTTTTSGGAGKAKFTDLGPLRGRHVVLLPDNDPAGRKHAEDLGARLDKLAAEVRLLNLPDLPEKGDVSNWLDRGGTTEALRQLANTAPRWAPSPGNTKGESAIRELRASDLYDSHEHQASIEFLPLLGESGYVARGWSHLLAAFPKAGKTSVLAQCATDWAASETAVLFITEEGERVWFQRLHATGQRPPEGLVLLFALGADADAILDRAATGPEEVVIVDTIRGCIGFADENDNAEVARTINAWVGALRSKTLVLTHHMRKSDGGEGRGVAGAGALVGAVDRILELRHDSADDRRRVLHVISRIQDAPDLLIEQKDDEHGRTCLRALGSPAMVSKDTLKERILGVLRDRERPADLEDGPEGPADPKEIKEALDEESERKTPKNRIYEALNDLADEGRVIRSGDGKRGKPFRWSLPPTDETAPPPKFDSSALEGDRGQNESEPPRPDPDAGEFDSSAPLPIGGQNESGPSQPPEGDPGLAEREAGVGGDGRDVERIRI